ncbi:MAG: UDP-N-acetylglucosamine 1-carboxyvinyltransferase [Ignavibacteria bacterium]|nr:UDP-N-acetylglucosamine 1-carboxyvinyltransferase [Ignavibacteria bacterium]
MDRFVINGGKPLSGTVAIGGAKNAVLAFMPATLLAPGVHRLSNTPSLRDITTMGKLLEQMGCHVSQVNDSVTIDSSTIRDFAAPYEHVKKMRASIYVLGPLVARYGQARVSLPGGCAWGPRPVNLHIEGLKVLGAEIDLDAGYIVAKAKRLEGARIVFDTSSVGATGNVAMAAVLARGTTIIENAAIEPEITALLNHLVTMGAKIHGIGSPRLEIEGVDALAPANAVMIPDRIEAGTFLVAAAICGGKKVTLERCNPAHLSAILMKLREAGAILTVGPDTVSIESPPTIRAVDVVTAVYPGFPTDMQAQWIALMAVADGQSVVTDTIYRDRFMHVPELNRLGARITLTGNVATIRGVSRLQGAKVMSTDLRASASLILAGLAAHGTTEVLRVYHLDRGYARIEQKLQQLGADIEREKREEF